MSTGLSGFHDPTSLKNIKKILFVFRYISDMLGAVLHLQHHGCLMLQDEGGLSAGGNGLHRHVLARLHEQLRQPHNLHPVQPRVSQGLSQDPGHIVAVARRRCRHLVDRARHHHPRAILPPAGMNFYP